MPREGSVGSSIDDRSDVTGTSSEARSGRDPDVELSRASEETSEDSRTKGAPILVLIRRDYTAYAQQVYGRAGNYIETVVYLCIWR
ncbi:hypothetical protein IEO21_08972 [Rhodonia placenta]|uniref:Uncharacterized protein n=1 Tax=Rhodonia placenta TaxID=104341 RepID=A0A8H7TYW8_9APHY|nr:hypothetical protein IEO21_08972 [Postia placenta]